MYINNNRKIIFSIILIIIFYIFYNKFSNIKNNIYELEDTKFLMNTYFSIKLYGKNKKIMKKIKNESFKNLEILDSLCNRYKTKNNNINWINKNYGKKLIINNHLFKQIELSIYYNKKSDGLFNIALGDLIDLWKEKEKENKLPNNDEIKKALEKSNFNNIELDLKSNSILLKKNIKIDLGSIAKGYSIEEISKLIKINSEITGAIINGGGNIKVLGKPNHKNNYKIGIQSPTNKNNLIGTTILKNNQSISTSGDYERYYFINKKKYSHILSPKNGFPIKENSSVSVITNSALNSDILSTILYLMSQKKGEEFLKNLPFKAEALWITFDKKIIKTKNFKFIFNNKENIYKNY